MAEKALELQGVGRAQAEVDREVATAAAELIKALDGVETAAIQLHSLILIKVRDAAGPRVVARTLTLEQLMLLEERPELLQNPETLLLQINEPCSSVERAPRHRRRLKAD